MYECVYCYALLYFCTVTIDHPQSVRTVVRVCVMLCYVGLHTVYVHASMCAYSSIHVYVEYLHKLDCTYLWCNRYIMDIQIKIVKYI